MTKNEIKHVIWDWNGTLLNDMHVSLSSINIMLGTRNLPLLNLESYRKMFGFPVIDCYRVLGFKFETNAEWDVIAREFHSHYNRLSSDASLTDAALPLLEHFKAAGTAMSVLSASETTILEKMLAERNIRHYFARVYGQSDLYGSSKVNLGRKLLSEIGIPSDQILLIGDTTHDHEVATQLNCRCILYLGGHQDNARLQRCGCRTIKSLRELMAKDERSQFCRR
jgi:phosphoglycolate phosphatase